ncbi:MAG: STAS domain-containing protein [Croceitalea sp.]|nr:STAS domain-containing protein [Croceitalea sp.]NNL09393.1 STAS domain-containing protein [Croceitalea sp.]
MALEIRENRGIFEILGKISSQNLGAVKIYFESALEYNEHMVISLEKVTEIDASAALFFESLYRSSAERNKVVTLVGKENRDISEVMKSTNTNYIFNADRI